MGAEIMEKIKIENGITYELRGDIYNPCLALPEQTHYPIDKYGNLRLAFLKEHRKGIYTTLSTEFRLNQHLHDIDVQAHEMLDNLLLMIAKSRGIDEQLKATDQLRWVAEMNNAKAAVEEIIFKELIYA